MNTSIQPIAVAGTDITGEYNPRTGAIALTRGLRVVHTAIIAMWCHPEVVSSYIAGLTL